MRVDYDSPGLEGTEAYPATRVHVMGISIDFGR